MKEKERLKEFIEALRNEHTEWAVEIHGNKIWHAIMSFTNGLYARGYSILADMDRDLPWEVRRMRGLLIALGRARKAHLVASSVAPIVNRGVLDLLLSYNCPSPDGEKFHKGQYAVKPTAAELRLLSQPQQPPAPATSGSVPIPPHWRDRFLVDTIHRIVGPGGVEHRFLVSRLLEKARENMVANPADVADDLRKIYNDEWLEANGLTTYTKKFVAIK